MKPTPMGAMTVALPAAENFENNRAMTMRIIAVIAAVLQIAEAEEEAIHNFADNMPPEEIGMLRTEFVAMTRALPERILPVLDAVTAIAAQRAGVTPDGLMERLRAWDAQRAEWWAQGNFERIVQDALAAGGKA